VKEYQIFGQGEDLVIDEEPTASGQEGSFLTIMCAYHKSIFVAGLWQTRNLTASTVDNGLLLLIPDASISFVFEFNF